MLIYNYLLYEYVKCDKLWDKYIIQNNKCDNFNYSFLLGFKNLSIIVWVYVL